MSESGTLSTPAVPQPAARAPSESRIDAAIDALPPGEFQRFVERILSGERTSPRTVVPLGRDARARTRPGWPDAFIHDGGGQIELVEATKDQRNWRRHFASDISRLWPGASKSGTRLTLVAWTKEPAPEQISSLVRQFAASTGLPPSQLRLIFRSELVTLTRQPRFAREWLELLGLPISPWPFVRIEDADVYGSPDVEFFVPTQDEYYSGLVTRPSHAQVVVRALKDERAAVVTGSGASGKTVLATAIALDHAHTAGPAYYVDMSLFDLAAPSSVREIAEAISVWGDSDVLFVVDNGHQDPKSTAEVARSWAAVDDGSSLLIVQRDTDHFVSRAGRAPLLSNIEIRVVRLSPTETDLLGVYSRIARRGGFDAASPPDTTLRSWARTFAGDLIAFSAAVAQRKPSSANWALEAQDSAAYVRDSYLSGPRAERQALLRVAAASRYETLTPEVVVDVAGVLPFLRRGVVERVARAYRTIHPGLGTLLLAAGAPAETEDARGVYPDIAGEDPVGGLRLARRMSGREAPDLIAETFRRSFTRPDLAMREIVRTHSSLGLLLSAMNSVDVSTREVETALLMVADEEAWSELDAVDGAQVLAALSAIRRWLPMLHRRRYREPWTPGLRDAVMQRLLAARPEHTAGLLKAVRQKRPDLYGYLADALADPLRLQRMFATSDRISLARCEELIRAATRSPRFRTSLSVAVDASRPLLWTRLRNVDARALYAICDARSLPIAEALVDIQRCGPIREDKQGGSSRGIGSTSSFESALVSPRACHRHIRHLVAAGVETEPVADALAERQRASGLKYWRSYRTALEELLAYADEHAPAVAAIVREATADGPDAEP